MGAKITASAADMANNAPYWEVGLPSWWAEREAIMLTMAKPPRISSQATPPERVRKLYIASAGPVANSSVSNAMNASTARARCWYTRTRNRALVSSSALMTGVIVGWG